MNAAVGTDCEGCVNVMDIDWQTRTCPEMGTKDCQLTKRQKRTERNRKPVMMPEPAVYYSKSDSRYPETIRISFSDGHTEIYDRRVNQPRPNTYVNSPYGRRIKK